ncbi:hypothetical protein B296_00006172 [Ensete ventricosum]|uniref:Uncharacterized protein n=1 Tax=Ensete ventricosum TaxID=4639 RepID=A0A426Z8W3_ENSVE|nr:hypothetical protein B296_00006172 [Ensete ventricosum]
MWSRAHRKFDKSWLKFEQCCREFTESSPKACQEVSREFADRLLWAKIKLGHRAKVRTMQWELGGSSLGVCRRNREARWEHIGRSPEEDCKTCHKNTRGYQISGRVKQSQLFLCLKLHAPTISLHLRRHPPGRLSSSVQITLHIVATPTKE